MSSHRIRQIRRNVVALDRASGRWTVGHLLFKLGMDAAWVKRFSSAAGRATAKAYRETTGSEPQTARTLRHGRIRTVAGYASLVDLLGSLLTYKRLRAELGI